MDGFIFCLYDPDNIDRWQVTMSTFAFVQDGETRRTSRSFFRGETTNFHPTDRSLMQSDSIDAYVIKGWAPKEKFVTRDLPIVAFGSCFASNISNYLNERGYSVLNKTDNNAYVTKLGDGMVNTYAILQQFEWAWLNVAPKADVWHGKKAEGYESDESVRLETKALFDQADMFIITLGLSELWYDEPTGEVFWRAVPSASYDPNRHKFRTATHAETLENLRKIYNLIRRFRPHAKILFSVSPIPLTATFRDVSCLSADAVSKATIRSALDEFLADHTEADGVYYFPSYEAVTRIFRNQWGDDRRHVRHDVLTFNMKMFERYYCAPGIDDEELMQAYNRAWELDLQKGENMRNRPVKAYQEARDIRKQAKIAARIEARKIEREQIVAARVAEREKVSQQVQPRGTKKKRSFLSSSMVQIAGKAVVGLFALYGAFECIGLAFAALS